MKTAISTNKRAQVFNAIAGFAYKLAHLGLRYSGCNSITLNGDI